MSSLVQGVSVIIKRLALSDSVDEQFLPRFLRDGATRDWFAVDVSFL